MLRCGAGEQALAHQKITGHRLGDCLVELGLVQENALLRFLAQQFNTRFVSAEKLAKATIAPSVLDKVPVRMAEAQDFLPIALDVERKILSIVMAEPQNGAPNGFYTPEERLYALQGQLLRDLRVQLDTGQVVLKHGKVEGYMDGMTMPFSVADRAEVLARRPGDLVTATLVVEPTRVYLEHLTATGTAPLPDGVGARPVAEGVHVQEAVGRARVARIELERAAIVDGQLLERRRVGRVDAIGPARGRVGDLIEAALPEIARGLA